MVRKSTATMGDGMPERFDREEEVELVRYVTGRSSPAEAAAFEAALAADPELAARIDSYREVWAELRDARGEWDTDAAWAELRQRHEEQRLMQRLRLPAQERRPARRVPVWFGRVAAMLVLALGGMGVWGLVPWESLWSGRPVEMSEYLTSPGQRARLRLPDGSQVILSVDTRLRIPENFGRKSRDLYLEGEAIFEVEHDERRPFRVHTEGLISEDLGTRFSVRRYAEDSATAVAVTEGRVELKPAVSTDSAEPHLLDPGDFGRVNDLGEVEIERGIDTESLLAWADGRLVFRDMPLGDVVAQLRRWYATEVRLGDPALSERRVSASFHREPLQQVLNLLALTLDLAAEREGAAFVIRTR